jgi:hypothetical protein
MHSWNGVRYTCWEIYAIKYADLKAVCDMSKRKALKQVAWYKERSRLPVKPVDMCTIDSYGSLPAGRGGVKYTLFVSMYFQSILNYTPLQPATVQLVRTKIV